MNRNNFLPHVAFALVLILVAAFAGQLRRWQKEWKSHVRVFPGESKRRAVLRIEGMAPPSGPVAVRLPEVLVKFRDGVSEETIQRITARLNDQVEDEI